MIKLNRGQVAIIFMFIFITLTITLLYNAIKFSEYYLIASCVCSICFGLSLKKYIEYKDFQNEVKI